jgi:hypothetical protein
MTPIQTHEKELRTLMERAGLASAVRTGMIAGQPAGNDWTVPALLLSESDPDLYVASYGAPGSRRPLAEASHPDPRIALRHCLEMAGLLVDRPPQTDEQLVAWLTERYGEPEHGYTWHLPDGNMAQKEGAPGWWRYQQRVAYARELGAILWCAERFPEVQS